MEKRFIMVSALALLIALAPGLHAADGKNVFLTKCAQCHGSGGEAKKVSSTKYAAVQWQRFFDSNKHDRFKKISTMLSPDETKAIKVYLMQHAADSDKIEDIGKDLK